MLPCIYYFEVVFPMEPESATFKILPWHGTDWQNLGRDNYYFLLGRDRDGITYRYLFVMKKVFNWSELHLSEVTSYKIHILVTILNRRTDLFFYHDHYEVANVTTFLVTFFDW